MQHHLLLALAVGQPLKRSSSFVSGQQRRRGINQCIRPRMCSVPKEAISRLRCWERRASLHDLDSLRWDPGTRPAVPASKAVSSQTAHAVLATKRADLCGPMFRNSFQSGFLSILYSLGSRPLEIWAAEGDRPAPHPAACLPLTMAELPSLQTVYCFTSARALQPCSKAGEH